MLLDGQAVPRRELAFNEGLPSRLLNILEVFAQQVHAQALGGQDVSAMADLQAFRDLVALTASQLTAGLDEGFSGAIEREADSVLISSLKSNVYVFSGAKTHQELRQLTDLLYEGDEVRSLPDFLSQVKLVSKAYNEVYLKSEYNHAIASGQMTRKWQELTKDIEKYDLMYDAVNDERTRAEHARYDGVIRPADDPFWARYYPPNGWGCRCSVRRVRKGKKESQPMPDNADGRDLAPMFRNNTARSGVAFPPKHPYFEQSMADREQSLGEALDVYAGAEGIKPWKAYYQWARTELTGRKIPVRGLGVVEFNNTAISEAINQPHKHKAEKRRKLLTIADRLAGFKGSFASAPDEKRNSMVNQYHYLPIEIAGETSYIVIREMTDGKKIFYSITDKRRGE